MFKHSVMRKPNKSVLGTSLTNGVTTVITEIDTSCVLDGEALLHRVRCLAGNIYKEVTMQYMSYMSVIDMEHVASFSTAIQVDPH